MMTSTERKRRKMTSSRTNHGFTIPTKFCQESHVKTGEKWEWSPCPSSGLILLFPVNQMIGQPSNPKNVVKVQQMRFKRKNRKDRIQKKLNIPIELIRFFRLDVSRCKIEWILTGEHLHGEVFLNEENVRH